LALKNLCRLKQAGATRELDRSHYRFFEGNRYLDHLFLERASDLYLPSREQKPSHRPAIKRVTRTGAQHCIPRESDFQRLVWEREKIGHPNQCRTAFCLALPSQPIGLAGEYVLPPPHRKIFATHAGKIRRFRGDKLRNNGDNRYDSCLPKTPLGTSSVFASRTLVLLMAAMAGGAVLQPSHAQAQWWGSRGPADFEECADVAEKAATKEARTAALSECNAKFAGRRKLGGGYTYFDFMQNRSFDIAGPNPTPEEQKHIDQQYTAYLDNQRRSSIAAAFAARQQQLQQASLKREVEKTPATTGSTGKPQTAASDVKRMKAAACTQHSFSCDWPRLSESIKDLKKALFGSPSPSKAKKS
jgi:hypothetical protein